MPGGKLKKIDDRNPTEKGKTKNRGGGQHPTQKKKRREGKGVRKGPGRELAKKKEDWGGGVARGGQRRRDAARLVLKRGNVKGVKGTKKRKREESKRKRSKAVKIQNAAWDQQRVCKSFL